MHIHQETDDFIKHLIDDTLGLQVPEDGLRLKIQALEESNHRLRGQYLAMKSALKEKDEAIERARSEAAMNAQALKRFVEENKRLANECANLVTQCSKWENECSLYDHDREALMEFGNEADERAKAAETRVQELEEELIRVSEENHIYKRKCERVSVGSLEESLKVEQNLLHVLMSSLVNGDEVEEMARAFLCANGEVAVCRKLNKLWNCLRPATRCVLALAAQVQILQRDKEQMRINLHRAEDEVKLLDEENKKLLKQYYAERKHCSSSGGKHDSSTLRKSNKRKQSPRSSSPIPYVVDSPREALSPLKENSPEMIMQRSTTVT